MTNREHGELVAKLRACAGPPHLIKAGEVKTLGEEAADLIESLSLRMRRMEEALRQIAEERVWGLEITTEDLRDIARAALTQ